jgi:hypothetical protein
LYILLASQLTHSTPSRTQGDVFYDAEDGDRALQEYSEAIAIHCTPNALMQRVRLIKKLAPTDDADEKADR